MKRVIEIHESDFKDIQEYDTIFEEENADIAKAIKTSELLNEVLDKIADEVKKVNAPRCRDFNGYFEGRTEAVERVLEIINKYKESEDK